MNARIGVGVFVFNSKGEFILGQRKGSHGAGHWALPGGHLEFNESFETCAEREVLEETGVKVKDIKFLTATNDVMKSEGKHYVTIFVGCRLEDENATLTIMEPEKCEEWRWASWEDVASLYEQHNQAETEGTMATFEGKVLFTPLVNLFRQRSGLHPWDIYKQTA
ncbi:nudix hydrolase 1 [Aspergillus campestris IBT 28561]|uniref:Nudix hydrolase 1 n=1 Tax=Aspergillus campestris (strain IBT 28561) TaxID=1392248 RepID=A0A2I1DGP9_ASPC2|nr:nudix hydrolase 1 [Aspergillus campestris IBT 28561]PKY09048.1 nudix hydrolase 1 [Aspergillus campestris IBT 28561]